MSRKCSNWRATKDLDSYLKENDIPGIQAIDTRALTRHIREAGAMRAIISSIDPDPSSLIAKARRSPGLIGRDLTAEVTCTEAYGLGPRNGPLVVVLDFGVKNSILRLLYDAGCRVTVVGAGSTVDDILSLNPDGVLLSNGPGDPAAVAHGIETIRSLLNRKTIPLFGICLGHQLLGLALGGKTYKLKFGHHGSNHPVKDLRTGKIHITAQNHGFCVDMDTLDNDDIEMTHINLYDGTLEGMKHKMLPVFSVQFHPEAGPGPHDVCYLFDDFVKLISRH